MAEPRCTPAPAQVNNQTGEIAYLKKRITELETMNAELRQERERIRDEKGRLQSQVETMCRGKSDF